VNGRKKLEKKGDAKKGLPSEEKNAAKFKKAMENTTERRSASTRRGERKPKRGGICDRSNTEGEERKESHQEKEPPRRSVRLATASRVDGCARPGN